MINALYHSGTDTTIQFPVPPLRSGDENLSLPQCSGRDSDGGFYSYSRSTALQYEQRLIYPQVSTAVRDALDSFVQSRNGDKNPFTWYDETGAVRTARFADGKLTSHETTPGRWRCEFTLMVQS